MKIKKTKSFELAIYEKGNPGSEKLALIVPGRLDTKDYIHNTSLVDLLGEQGYHAIAFDPAGTWASAGGIDDYTMTNCIKAVDELIEYYGNKPTVLLGHSRGGSISMYCGPRNKYVTHFVSIMSLHGAPSAPSEDELVNNILVEYRDLPPGNSRSEEKIIYNLPISYFEDGSQYDALSELQTCIKPKLFFIGTKDVMNQPAECIEAFNAAAEPKILKYIETEHDYRLHPEIIEEVNNTIGDFLREHP